ncbi:MAG: ABC transporter permease [Erysipelotrichaceae bacterium]|nr:ABC transporter permease [Erysipelotrichaceae bacterium]
MSEMNPISFKKVPKSEKNTEKILRPSSTFLKDAWYRFKRNKLGLFGAAIIILMILFAVFGPIVIKADYMTQNLSMAYQGPSAGHPMGTDALGRDLFVRMAYGARISLSCGFVAALISLVIGVTYGTIAGFVGGAVDNVMMRIVDIISSIPSMLYLILFMVVLGNSLWNVFLVIGITGWQGMARLVRGEVLSLKQREFVLAAKVSNVSNWNIMWKHLIPNAFGPIIVSMTLSIPSAIFLEASLQFLGLGITAPMPSWGGLAQEGIGAIRTFPHMLWYPALFISITILAFNFMGDALRDALDPKQN